MRDCVIESLFVVTELKGNRLDATRRKEGHTLKVGEVFLQPPQEERIIAVLNRLSQQVVRSKKTGLKQVQE